MSRIEVHGLVLKKYKVLAERVAKSVIVLMKQPDNLEVAVNFVSKRKIKKLNNDYRSINKVTDVLSFPSTSLKAGEILNCESEECKFLLIDENNIHFGDMALCLSRCKKQAKEYGVLVCDELKKLVIHSMLHLMGYDHIKDEDFEIMKRKEEFLMKKID